MGDKMNLCENILQIVNDTFPLGLKENTLNFISYLNFNSLTFERLLGYWKNQCYYSVKYENESVCYILLNGIGDEQQFAPLTIWSDDSNSNWYENYPLSEEMKKIAWNNVDFCVHCGSCAGGTRKTVFGKQFENVCRTTFRFTNPNNEVFSLLKILVNARLDDIV
ncbi:MAG: hypothetical protein K2J59_00260 [Eubacterium sp.]|nr:hypothetical protein [Eubacterium sp.]